ncbi:hypothetical protein AAMO2058_000047000 [Amorphochlora amoebiformis]
MRQGGGMVRMWVMIFLLTKMASRSRAQSSFVQNLNGSCYEVTSRFDVGALACESCDGSANKTVSDNGAYCTCAAGFYKLSSSSDLLDFTCSSCLNQGQASSQDHTRCMYCDNSTSTLDTTTGDCVCRTSGYVLVEKDQAGNYLANKTCLSCPSNTLVLSINPYACASCAHSGASMGSDGACTCTSGYTQAGDHWCVLSTLASPILSSYPLSTSSSITYSNVVAKRGGSSSSKTVTSHTFEQMFLAAASGCIDNRNRTSCSALANMCAVVGYDTSHPTCAIIKSRVSGASSSTLNTTHGFSEWIESMPLVYYTPDFSSSEALNFTVNIGTKLRFLLASFSFNGTYLGYDELDGQLQLCGRDPGELTNWLEAGTAYENNCVLNLANTISDLDTTTFYTLFISNEDLTTVYPVPVQLDGLSPDEGVARFFLLDVNSSIPTAGSDPILLQWASSITLSIPFRESDKSLLYPPRMTVEYTQRLTADVQAGGSTGNGGFKVVYTSSYGSFWIAVVVLFGLCVAWIAITWFTHIFAFCHLRAVTLPTLSTGAVARMVVDLLAVSANGLLFLVGLLSVIALILFKGQRTFFLILPAEGSSAENAFKALLLVVFFARLVSLSVRVWDQLHADVFFVDWEKPRQGVGLASGRGEGKEAAPALADDRATVSVWRRIVVINKYNELQSSRGVSVPLALFLILFFLSALQLEGLALNMPSDALEKEGVPVQPILRFGIVMVAWVVCAGSQVLFRNLCYRRYVQDISAGLEDLLHSANVSCLILDQTHHGYYLHGKSVHTHADTDLSQLSKQVAHETKALVRERGLLPGKDSFEVYFHPRFRAHYDRIYKGHLRRNLLRAQGLRRQLRRAADTRRNIAAMQPKRTTTDTAGELKMRESQAAQEEDRFRDLDEDITEKLLEVSQAFDQFLQRFVLGDDQDHKWQQSKMTCCMRCLGLPPHIRAGGCAEGPCCTRGGAFGCCFGQDSKEALEDDEEDAYKAKEAGRKQRSRIRDKKLDKWADGEPVSVFYHDSNRKFRSVFLIGIEFEIVSFLMLLHAVIDLAFQNTTVSVLVVAAVNYLLVHIRQHFGRDNLSKKTLLHERFFF